MKNQSDISRNSILTKIAESKKVRKNFAYIEPDWQKNIYKEIDGSLEECFAQEIAVVSGNCVFCQSDDDLFEKLKKLLSDKNINLLFCRTKEITEKLEKYDIPFSNNPSDFPKMEAGITFCEVLIARTGSVMVSAAHEAGRQMNIFPPIHIVLAEKSQLVPYIGDALTLMKQRYGDNLPSTITNITGPSRTADIEKTLILGAHGPKEFWVFLKSDS